MTRIGNGYHRAFMTIVHVISNFLSDNPLKLLE